MSAVPLSSTQPVKGRCVFKHEGKKVFEWEQTLEEVHVYISPPPGVTAQHLSIKIEPRRLTVGLKGNPPFIQQALFSLVDCEDSFWMVEDGELHIQLAKAHKAEAWSSVLKGLGEIDPYAKEKLSEKLLLERFQAENPQFDFSSAQFNGSAPSARTYMGGVKYS